MNWLKRKYFMWLSIKHAPKDLNRRVDVEVLLFDIADGKLPIPTREECRAMARYLGTRKGKKPVIKG